MKSFIKHYYKYSIIFCTISLACLSLDTNSLANTASTTTATHKANTSTPNKQVNWNFRNADIRAVINTVASLTGKNFVIDPRIQGKVSFISNHPMSLDEAYTAFLSMLRVLNYSAIPTGNITKIIPIMDARSMGLPISPAHPQNGDNMMMKVISLKHTNATNVLPIIQPFISPYGNIRAYAPANALMIAGTATNINHIMKMIEQLDKSQSSSISIVSLKHGAADKLVQAIGKLQQSGEKHGLYSNVGVVADEQSNSILITGDQQSRHTMRTLITDLDKREGANEGSGAQVIHLNYLSAEDITKTLSQTLTGSKGSKTPFPLHMEADKATNSIILSGPIDQRQNIERVIKQLDTRPKQVLVEAIIAEVSSNLASQLGVQWGMEADIPTGDGSSAAGIPTFKQGIGIIPKGNISAVITALAQNTSTNILATPVISVLNNEQANIKDGESISVNNRSYDSSSSSSDGENTPFTTQEYKDVGLSLKVTPRISPNRVVRLKLVQENDSLAKPISSTSVTDDNSNPAINTSGITTSVMVKSGDILVMGGLIKKDTQGNIQKVPILGDLPLLGRLFQYHNHSGEKKDLMVFIRPIILSNSHESNRATRSRYNLIRDEQLRQDSGIPVNRLRALPLLKNQYGTPKAIIPSPFAS